jgi:hypothetical protein
MYPVLSLKFKLRIESISLNCVFSKRHISMYNIIIFKVQFIWTKQFKINVLKLIYHDWILIIIVNLLVLDINKNKIAPRLKRTLYINGSDSKIMKYNCKKKALIFCIDHKNRVASNS